MAVDSKLVAIVALEAAESVVHPAMVGVGEGTPPACVFVMGAGVCVEWGESEGGWVEAVDVWGLVDEGL